MAENGQLIDREAEQVVKHLSDFMSRQQQRLREQIQSGSRVSRLEAGAKKMDLLTRVQKDISDIRILNFKAQARDEFGIIQDGLNIFNHVFKKLSKLESITVQGDYLESIDEIKGACQNYKASMEEILVLDNELEELYAKGAELGGDVLDQTNQIAFKGMERTKNVGSLTVDAVDIATWILYIGLALAVILGAIIAYLLTRSITQPIFRGVKFAQQIAAGDFSQKLDIEQKDEVGILANSLNQMVEELVPRPKSSDHIFGNVFS